MFLTFYGAAREVTGSCFLLQVSGKNVLIDCGLRQGTDVFDGEEDGFVFDASAIDYVLLTHAHIDHSGRLPLLYKKGFRGKIYCTSATKKLCNIMLLDSAHIQESDAEWKNRKNKRSGDFQIEPLYTSQDAENVSRLFSPSQALLFSHLPSVTDPVWCIGVLPVHVLVCYLYMYGCVIQISV